MVGGNNMKILNFGSLNIDYVYHVSHFVKPGETLQAKKQSIFCGGKGLNQSIALARAGAPVYHGGCIGFGGEMLKDALEKDHISIQLLSMVDVIQGNAVIQVDDQGENCILLYGGSNQAITKPYAEQVLSYFGKGDFLVLQNEISCIEEIITLAVKKEMIVVLNPSPFTDNLRHIDYDNISWLILNEIEGEQLSGEKNPSEVWMSLHQKYPHMNMVLTLGSAGAYCFTATEEIYQSAYPVQTIDTTAAGDTFTGYFLAGILKGEPLEMCMQSAAMAAAITVTRMGAAVSIPYVAEVKERLQCFH
jgi:ribokinase